MANINVLDNVSTSKELTVEQKIALLNGILKEIKKEPTKDICICCTFDDVIRRRTNYMEMYTMFPELLPAIIEVMKKGNASIYSVPSLGGVITGAIFSSLSNYYDNYYEIRVKLLNKLIKQFKQLQS